MSRPMVRALPAADAAFRAAVDAAVRAGPADADPGDVQRRIRERYPFAVVVPRSPKRWDVYRFGSAPAEERWWTAPDLPWAVLDDERRFVDVSAAIAAIVEAPPEAVVGQSLDAFASADDPTVELDIEGVWAVFLAAGELDGTLRFRHNDGTPRELDYHLVRAARGPGRHLAIVRERPTG